MGHYFHCCPATAGGVLTWLKNTNYDSALNFASQQIENIKKLRQKIIFLYIHLLTKKILFDQSHKNQIFEERNHFALSARDFDVFLKPALSTRSPYYVIYWIVRDIRKI